MDIILLITQPIRKEVKVGRNDPRPCGSGKKYKQCHGRLGAAAEKSIRSYFFIVLYFLTARCRLSGSLFVPKENSAIKNHIAFENFVLFLQPIKPINMKKLLFTLMLMFSISIGFAQKYVLVEELTGTWCQWCPRGIYYGDSLCQTHDNVIFIAIHCSDPMANEAYYQASGLLGAPSANIGRHYLGLETQNWFDKVEQESQIPSKVYMGITCDYDPETRQLTADVGAMALENMSGDYRFAAILIEDGVTGPAPSYNQTNSYSGGGNGPMGGFENTPNPIPAERMAYDHVGRQLLCDYNGVPNSFPSSMQASQSANYEFSCTLDESYDYNYVRVIGLLIAPDGTIENAVKSPYLNGDETAAPLFTSTAKTEAYANLNYLYNVYFHDPDPSDYVTIRVLQGPSWLHLEQYDGKSACLYGTPDQPGSYEVRLELSDCLYSPSQDFTIVVDEPLSGSWEYVGPRGFSQNSFQVFGIDRDNDGNLYVFGNQSNTPVLYKNAAGTDAWEQMGSINTSCSVSAGGMDVSSNGDVYVAYSDQGDAGHAFKWDGSQWMTIGSAFSSVETHIILDNNDLPYLVARDVSQGYKGVVFKLENDSWVPLSGTGVYVPDAEYACHQDLAFDSDNTPYIAYADYMASNLLKVRKFENGEWVTVGSGIDNIYFYQSLALDENDMPYLAYCAFPSYQLRAVRFNGNNFESLGDNLAEGAVSELNACFNESKFTVAFINDGQSNYLSVLQYEDEWSYVGPSLVSEGAMDDPCIIADNGTLYVAYSDDGLQGFASCMKYAETAILYPPTDFAAEVFGNDNVRLTWNLPIEGTPTSYKLYRDDALLATATELTYNDYGIPAGTHRYTLSAVYPEGESVQAGPVVVETTESIDENGSHFLVYPTIVTSSLTIKSQTRGSVVLYNTIGQQVMETQLRFGTNLIDISKLPKGAYLLRLADGKTVKVLKN